MGSPKFLTVLSQHATLSDPGGIYAGSPNRPFHIGFRDVNHVAFRMFTRLTGLNRLRACGHPCGLLGAQPTLRLSSYLPTRKAYYRLSATSLPYRDFHSIRTAKLRLAR